MTASMPRRLVLALLLVLAVCPYFMDLGGSSIWDANEAYYVETPREMIERGDLIAPTFNYEPRFNKPVLSYWIVAGFYKVFGVSVGVQRIPIALGAIVMVLTAFFLARAAWPVSTRG
jgi:4-amino-4-deoxy-L-arabinose transferase-like glycosyltransferase